MNVDRLLEQARELAERGWWHARDDVRDLLAGLADAVEQLQREREEVEFQLRGGWDEDGPAVDGLDGLDLSEMANVLHSTAVDRYVELHESRARVAALEASLKNIALARCLGDIRPPGCSGTCVTCEARAALEGTVSEVRVGAIAEMRERVAALEAGIAEHRDEGARMKPGSVPFASHDAALWALLDGRVRNARKIREAQEMIDNARGQ